MIYYFVSTYGLSILVSLRSSNISTSEVSYELVNYIDMVMFIQIDIQLETGEYFLSDKTKSAKKWQEKQEKQAEKTAENKRKREAAFMPPEVLNFCSYCWSFWLMLIVVIIPLFPSYNLHKHFLLFRSLKSRTTNPRMKQMM